jgi:hypothetical protein
MNVRLLVGSAVIAAVTGTCTIAGAQTVGVPIPVTVPHPHPHQQGSNDRVWAAEHHLRGMIARLERDDRDYGGHRVAALNHLHDAHNELLAAERFARARGYGTGNTGYRGPNAPVGMNHPRRDEQQSDTSIADAQRAVTKMIRRLEGDASDYGGHRVAAIAQLRAAESELLTAERYESTSPR